MFVLNYCSVLYIGPAGRHDPNPILHPVVFALKNHMRSLSQVRWALSWIWSQIKVIKVIKVILWPVCGSLSV